MQAVVVGGSGGIGRAVVQGFIDRGYSVTNISRTPAAHKGVDCYTWDATSKEAPPQLDGPIHALVYLPGTINLKPFKNLKMDDFEHDLRVNFLGAVEILQAYLPQIEEGAQECTNTTVTFMSTVAVQTGFSYHASISAAKGAIEGMTRSLAAELAPRIRVNAVAPSLTQTPLSEVIIDTDLKLEASKKRHPLKRIGSPEDLAEAILYLATEKSRWITGQILHVDGGISSIAGP